MDITSTHARAADWCVNRRKLLIYRAIMNHGIPARDAEDVAQDALVLAMTDARCRSPYWAVAMAAGAYRRRAHQVCEDRGAAVQSPTQEAEYVVRQAMSRLGDSDTAAIARGEPTTSRMVDRAKWRKVQQRAQAVLSEI